MTNSEEKQQPSGDGTDFIKQQRDLDQAKNERANEESRNQPSAQAKDQENTKTDVSHKKTGGGKQVSPGT